MRCSALSETEPIPTTSCIQRRRPYCKQFAPAPQAPMRNTMCTRLAVHLLISRGSGNDAVDRSAVHMRDTRLKRGARLYRAAPRRGRIPRSARRRGDGQQVPFHKAVPASHRRHAASVAREPPARYGAVPHRVERPFDLGDRRTVRLQASELLPEGVPRTIRRCSASPPTAILGVVRTEARNMATSVRSRSRCAR